MQNHQEATECNCSGTKLRLRSATNEFEPEEKKEKVAEEVYNPVSIPSCCKNVTDPAKLCSECFKALLIHHIPTCILIRKEVQLTS